MMNLVRKTVTGQTRMMQKRRRLRNLRRGFPLALTILVLFPRTNHSPQLCYMYSRSHSDDREAPKRRWIHHHASYLPSWTVSILSPML
ncbi:expressed unknown protein [Seminavis robusta]|uniref:Uncharacterized protein n=1 Tax=Seminavis robusta TaxID=568900 RepID=A0A9N8DT74_9STRA|nr:expressed unknown protein [Seminavis robusta]|eukprot:Sro260_g101681.1  (88) ;mRNA; r:83025-83288